MLSGMASGAVAVCIGTPFDVALVRMQSDSMLPMKERRGYKNVFDALIRMTKEEGKFPIEEKLELYLFLFNSFVAKMMV